jgi:hypothetical protein
LKQSERVGCLSSYPTRPELRAMCRKCDEIDRELDWLQLADPGLDSLSRAIMRADLESLNAEKTSLHCDGGDHGRSTASLPRLVVTLSEERNHLSRVSCLQEADAPPCS